MATKNSHLSLELRLVLQQQLTLGTPKAQIAGLLGKDKPTIGKEIQLHRKSNKQWNLF